MSEVKKYYGLSVVVKLLKIIIWFIGIGSVVYSVNYFSDGNFLWSLFALIIGLVNIIFLLLISYFFQVLTDIEYNTRADISSEKTPTKDEVIKQMDNDYVNKLIANAKQGEVIVRTMSNKIEVISEKNWADIVELGNEDKFIIYN